MDTNIKRWHWTQWVLIPVIIYYFFGIFSNKLIYIKQFGLNTTPLVLASVGVTIFNCFVVYGLMLNSEMKKFLILSAVPVGLIVASFAIFLLVKISFPIQIIFTGYLNIIFRTALVSVVCALFNYTNEVYLISEKELKVD